MVRDPDLLRERLATHLIQGDRITGVTPLSTGHSNETYLLEGLDLILRLPPGGNPLIPFGHGMRVQYELYAILRGMTAAPPVPAVRYFCADEDVLGAPFFLMERVHGDPFDDYGGTEWMNEAEEGFRASVTQHLIEATGRYNALPPLDLLGTPLDNTAELRRWRGMAAEARDDELMAAFDELESNAAPPTGPPALVHGDAKFSNVLWRDGTVVAVLDVEMSFNGEPAWDLGYLLMYFPSEVHGPMPGCGLPGMWDRETVIAAWERITGRSAREIGWYEAAAMAKVTAILTYGAYLAATGGSSDERMLGWKAWRDAKLVETRDLIAAISATAGATPHKDQNR
jgi:aminoglycoside phosphotransferase (APT) family kinase protein